MVEKITDKEIDFYFEYKYKSMLEDEFLKSSYGRRIKFFEKMGVGITFEEALDLYIEKAGITTDKVGNAIIEEEYANDVYQGNLQIVSKQIGFDITNLGFEQIEKIAKHANEDIDIKESLKQEKYNADKEIKEIKAIIKFFENTKPLKDICNELKINTANYAPKLGDLEKILQRKGMTQEQAKAYVEKYEKETLDTFIESQSDIYLIEGISYLHLIRNGNIDVDLDYETEKQMFAILAEKYTDSKYYEKILNENGEVDLEKAEKFYLKFIEDRNAADLTRKLSKYFTYTEIPDLDTQKDIFVTILRAYNSNDPIQIKNAAEIARNLNIDLLGNKGNLSNRKIQKYGRKYFGKNFDVDEVVHLSEFNDDTIAEQLERITRSILDYEPIPTDKTVDALNEYKEKQKSKEKITCSKKEEVTRSILNGKNKMTPEQILAIYCKFRCLEVNERRIVENNKNPLSLTSFYIAIPQNYGVAAIIRKYIIENKDKFSEYLTEGNDLDCTKIMQTLENKEFSFNERMDINGVFGEIRRQTRRIERREKEHELDIKDLKKNMSKLRKGQLSDQEKKEMYRNAKHLHKDKLLSTEIIEELKELDSESFEKNFKKSDIEAMVAQGSFKAFIYGKVGVSFRKAFVELPGQILNRNEKQFNIYGLDQRLIKSLEKMRTSKEKLAQKLVLGDLKKKEERKNTQLPVVKKTTIFDKIKNMFSKPKLENNIEDIENKKIESTNSERNTNSQIEGIESENLTITENSDKTVNAQAGGLDYLKVETTPVFKETSTVVESNNQNQIDNPESEEPEIGE